MAISRLTPSPGSRKYAHAGKGRRRIGFAAFDWEFLMCVARVIDRVFGNGPSTPNHLPKVISLTWPDATKPPSRERGHGQPCASPTTPSEPLSPSGRARYRRVPFMMFLSRSSWMCSAMPSDPPSPARPPKRPTAQRTQTPQRSALTPAQAIAQAWMRESPESQKKWRAADAQAKDRYTDPLRPWNTAGRSPERKAKGKL
ncbi:hypothetical protein BC628DRAFT_535227 [Trametes gibbosa]|nr:hypothetical protein BC628DRAFT_535227 [Trametes gibbosa]